MLFNLLLQMYLFGILLFSYSFVVLTMATIADRQYHSSPTDKCTVAAPQCVPIPSTSNRTCLGNHLPYSMTAPQPLVEDVVRYELEMWTVLRALPACWDKLQFFLCSVYIPECIEQTIPPNQLLKTQLNRSRQISLKQEPALPNSDIPHPRIILPEAEMCDAVHKACPLLSSSMDRAALGGFGQPLLRRLPHFLDCSLYTPGCRQNSLTSRLFRSTDGGCVKPLITTTYHANWLTDIDRCGLPCHRPHFDAEHYSIGRWLIGCSMSVCLCVNILTMLTLHLQRIDRNMTSNPIAATSPQHRSRTRGGHRRQFRSAEWSLHTPLFYIHFLLTIGCLGWLMPLVPHWGELIACRQDGTIRSGEPQASSNKSVLCILNMISVYFSLLAALVWSTIFDYMLFAHTRHLYNHLPPNNSQSISPDRKVADDLMTDVSDASKTNKSIGVNDVYPSDPSTSKPRRPSVSSPSRSHSVGLDGHHPLTAHVIYICFPHLNSLLGTENGRLNQTADGNSRVGVSPRHYTSASPQTACLHLLAISPPLIFILIGLTIGEIDGDSLSGLCFIGGSNIWARFGLVLVPITTCLIVKSVCLGQSLKYFNSLRRRFIQSTFDVDQEVATNLGRCACSYAVHLTAFSCLWLFSVGVQLYTNLGEPMWLESQRQIIICQIRQQLLGFTQEAAQLECDKSMLLSGASGTTMPISRPSKIQNTEFQVNVTHSDSDTTQVVTGSVPMIGPILLHLLVFPVWNLIFSSLVLLDPSVRYCWYRCFKRICTHLRFDKPHTSAQPKTDVSFAFSSNPDTPLQLVPYSWWDPGFFHPPFHLLKPEEENKRHQCNKNQDYTNPSIVQTEAIPLLTDFELPSIEHDPILNQLNRLASLYAQSSPDQNNPTSKLFRDLRDKLLDSSSTSAIPLSTIRIDGANNNDNKHYNADLMSCLLSMCENYQKQLNEQTDNANRPRGRHRRMLSHRNNSSRRRSQLRSLSSNGLSIPGRVTDFAESTISQANSDRPIHGDKDCESLLHTAAASLIASVNSGIRGATGDLPFSSLHSGGPSGAGSVSNLGGSQVSSSSNRSGLTGLNITSIMQSSIPNTSDVRGFSNQNRSISKSSMFQDHRMKDGGGGSRISLRSCGASSSGAESYNSYQLLLNQAGARWRDLWRTRMLLMNVLKWAEAVEPLTRGSLSSLPKTVEPPSNLNESSLNNTSDPELSDLIRQVIDQSRLVRQSNNHIQPADRDPICHSVSTDPSSITLSDPVMAVAFEAAKAAASVALQQQKQCRGYQPEPPKIQSPNYGVQPNMINMGYERLPTYPASFYIRSPVHPPPTAYVFQSTSPHSSSLTNSDTPIIYPAHALGATAIATQRQHSISATDYFVPPDNLKTYIPSPPPTVGHLVRFCGPPDLLADHHARASMMGCCHLTMPQCSPNYTPPPTNIYPGNYTAGSAHISTMGSFQHPSGPSPIRNPTLEPVVPPTHLSPGPYVQIQHQQDPHLMGHLFSPQSPPSIPAQPVLVAQKTSKTKDRGPNDSDEFDSEDDVMSENDEVVDLEANEQQKLKTSRMFLSPVAKDDGDDVCSSVSHSASQVVEPLSSSNCSDKSKA